jgi:hypothetical protein
MASALFDSPKKRRLFSADEDLMLRRLMAEHRFSTWNAISALMPRRSARQCRDRWANYLCPENKNAPWTDAEDDLLVAKFQELGPRWTTISKCFDGRSENNVKNRWYTHLRQRMHAPGHDAEERPAHARERLPPIESFGPAFLVWPIVENESRPQAIEPAALHPTISCFT